jgi:rubrerythrin
MAGRKKVFLICHYCGYEPPGLPASGRCPKCGGHSWERFAISRRLLPGAAR